MTYLKMMLAMISLLIIVACGPKPKTDQKAEEEIDSVALELKNKIDSATLYTYTDKAYNVSVSYPDFFDASDTLEAGTARICYPNTTDKTIALVMFVEPNVEGWNIHEAVEQLTDEYTECLEETDDYYILSGCKPDKSFCYLEKCYIQNDKWIDFTIYYLSRYKESVGRLLDVVKNWKPEPIESEE